MASVYGQGYYSDMDSLMIGIEKGLTKAFKLTCEQLVDDIKQWTDVYIYSTPESETYSPRTEEFRNAWNYEAYSVNNGLQEATFYIDAEKIKTRDTLYHNILRQGGTTNDLVNCIETTDHHAGFRDDIEFWIRDEFQKKYRANCIALGIKLK